MMQPKMKLRLKPKRDKIAEALLHLVHRAEAEEKRVTQFDLVKTLFFADTAHLEEFGRPVTYDNYVAMKHGPVASEAYDMLKETYYHSKKIDGWPLWKREKRGKTKYSFEKPTRKPNYKKLSVSDVNKLEEAQDFVWTLGFGGTSDLSHKHRAYVAVWEEGRTKGKEDMDYHLIMPNGEEDRAAELAFVSNN